LTKKEFFIIRDNTYSVRSSVLCKNIIRSINKDNYDFLMCNLRIKMSDKTNNTFEISLGVWRIRECCFFEN